ncbi:hypothetical protein N7541_006836 [Penicillium brevicompactum]|uniref:C2H2 type master regulator of conidiophore development brlA n=1 Tax=Penicillium brevicompactum TaxID=5074 RepID=A0A9W9R5V3_PENBR|nr:hypothetical protein N7541_006836 [Penicillium brevicompactum]
MAPGSGRDFNCSWEQCGKSFNRKSDLCRHYRIHTNERPYQCTVADCEKPHVCDHEGCHKAFSDSSSLARHRRIHTGKRPYVCHEPTCERSFCRKTTLTKHQHRSHPPGSLTRPSSEEASSEHSYATPVPVSISNEQYMLAQQSYYPQAATPTHEFYSPQSVQMTAVPVHEAAPTILPQNVPVMNSPIHMHAQHPQHPQHPQQHPHVHHQQQQQQQQQQYMQQMMQQQRFEQSPRTNYIPAAYEQAAFQNQQQHHHHQQQQPQQPPPQQQQQQVPSEQPIMVSYHSNYVYKPPGSRILNQPAGTDWGFLGVG